MIKIIFNLPLISQAIKYLSTKKIQMSWYNEKFSIPTVDFWYYWKYFTTTFL